MFGHHAIQIRNPKYSPKTQQNKNEEILGYTKKFIKFLKSQAGKKGFGSIIMTMGGPDSGKSCLMCILINIFLESDENRKAAFYQAPQSLLDAIKETAPPSIFNRVRIIQTLSEVKPFDIFCIDEGYLGADAKDALKRNKRNFIKSITTLRHQSVFTIINSLDNGILKGYRKKAQIQFFKNLPDGFIEEANISFLRKHQDDIATLKPWQTIFRISQAKFLDAGLRIGGLRLKKDKYCPWYSEKISRSFENEDFDAEKREEKRQLKQDNMVIEDIKNKYGERLGKTKAKMLVKGYLQEEKPNIFFDFKDRIGSIMERAYYRLDEEGLLKKNISESSELVQSEIMIPLNIDEAPKWFKEYYLTNQGDPLIAEIIEKWIEGIDQREIAFQKSISPTKLNKILKQYREGSNLANDDLRLGYAQEYWICHKTGAKRGGGISQPDLWYTILNLLYPGECKLLYDRSKSITLYQTLPDDANKTLGPSHEYCKLHNIPKFPLFFRNPSWGNFDMLIPIFVLGENKITLFKSKITEYVQNFAEFTPTKFFEVNIEKTKPKVIPKPKKNELIADILLNNQAEGIENISILKIVLQGLNKHFGTMEIKKLEIPDIHQFIVDNIPEQLYFGSNDALDSLSKLAFKQIHKKGP